MSLALEAEGLVAGYGSAVVLDGVSFAVPAGGTLAVLGRNGVGKTTLLATLMGFTTLRRGRIRLGGTAVEAVAPFRRNRLGLGYVPQEREIFASLSVEENLSVAARPKGWAAAAVFELFPGLRARRRNAGNQLSGGEQQMLAIGRALVGAPEVLLLDEPMEGLAPIVVDALYDALAAIRDRSGPTVILVEQKADLALRFAERAIVLDRGRIVHEGPCEALRADAALQSTLLGMGGLAPGAAAPGHGTPGHDGQGEPA
ncbi:ABC transporter ATP-binding protein [Roseomonas sp. BN140053]|uniref:ABC transporter ATP-binding protein n=1 Tax=Roseomonas sp. BN140053 TaxID=3391898 RepID=UPI0039EC22C9